MGFPYQDEVRFELLVDPATGRIVGEGSVALSRTADEGACSRARAEQLKAGGAAHPTTPAAWVHLPIPPTQQVRVPGSFWTTELTRATAAGPQS